MLPIIPSRDWALNLNKISECDRTYLKWIQSAFSSHIWSRQVKEGNYTSGYPVIRSWKIFHILQLSSVAASAADNYPTTLSHGMVCYLRALSTRPINKRWDWKMVNQLPMTLTSFMVTFSSWLVCEFLFFVAFVAAWLLTVENVDVKVMIEMQDEVMLLTSSVFRFNPMGISISATLVLFVLTETKTKTNYR